MFTVTFVRHGETKMNLAKIVQSRTPGELSDKGIQMAECLGQHLRNEKFTRVFSSDLTRCHDTTLLILKQSLHKQPDIILDAILRERDYGDLEFQPCSVAHEIYEKCEPQVALHRIPLPGGEAYEDAVKRTAKFFSGLCKLADASSTPENILVVTHGVWLMCFLDYLADNKSIFELKNCNDEERMVGPRNTATTKIIIHKKGENSNQDDKRKIEFIHIFNKDHLIAANIIPEDPDSK